MKQIYMAYANMVNGDDRWRVNILRDNDEQKCQSAAVEYAARYSKGPLRADNVGVHPFYLITPEEWESIGDDFKGKSIRKPGTKVVFEGSIPGNHGKGGTTLLFEHDHFEIERLS